MHKSNQGCKQDRFRKTKSKTHSSTTKPFSHVVVK